MGSRYQTVALGVIFVISLAGCMGVFPDSEPEAETTLSGVHTETQAGTVNIVFNDTVASDYAATVIIEPPNGMTIREQSPSGDDGIARIAIPQASAGDYTLQLIKNNQTIDTKTITLTSADLGLTVTANWDASTLSQIFVAVQNTGDLPTTASVAVSKGASTLYTTPSQTARGGRQTIFLIDPSDGLYTVNNSGPAKFSIMVSTANNTITKTLTHTIRPASVEITSVTPTWQTTVLKDLSYTVSNTGDLPATLDGSVIVAGDKAVEITDLALDAGETTTISTAERATTGSGTLYRADTGAIETRVRLGYNTTTVSASNTSTVVSTSADLEQVQTQWRSTNEDYIGLSDIGFTLQTGASSVSYNTLRIETGNQTVLSEGLDSGTILPNVDVERSYYVGGYSQIELPPGEHELIVSLRDDDELVLEQTVSVTAEPS